MAAPSQTIWNLEPHTRAKHEILKRYLQAWMIILSQGRFPEILYIDGFAGPGKYAGGEDGSPIIALDTALGYLPSLTAKVHFLFVEKDTLRSEHLIEQVKQRQIPSNFNVIIEGGATFESAFNKVYQTFVRNGRLIPTFAFIDPFGWAGAPFSLVKKILANRSCEVFVNFMYEEINRFINHPDQISNFNEFFGTDSWKQCGNEIAPYKRNRCLHDLYLKQLHTAATARYVRSFEMSNSHDVVDYYLFYATNEFLGLNKMKEAMWKVDERGEFRFSDATDKNQLILFENAPNFSSLKKSIISKFSGKSVSIADVENYVLTETAFRESHYKSILREMEKDTQQLKIVAAKPSRRIGTFGDPEIVIKIG
jgi:three-Cys-motif partner protein